MIIFKKFLIICVIVTAGFFTFFNFSFADGKLAPVPIGELKCQNEADGWFCYAQTNGLRPLCKKTVSNKDYYFSCAPAIGTQVEQVIEFKPPTQSTNFADLICKTTSFVSDTILPPIAVLMMLVAGYLFLTSGGAPQRAGLAQKALLFTAAGVVVLLLAPGIVTLIGDLFNNTSLKTADACKPSVTTSVIVTSFIKLINWFSWFVTVTSVVMGLYSGFLYITARDNPQQTQKAAKVLSFVIIGVAVSILAFSIITIVRQFAGLG